MNICVFKLFLKHSINHSQKLFVHYNGRETDNYTFSLLFTLSTNNYVKFILHPYYEYMYIPSVQHPRVINLPLFTHYWLYSVGFGAAFTMTFLVGAMLFHLFS